MIGALSYSPLPPAACDAIPRRAILRQWIKFNLVGAGGAVVQILGFRLTIQALPNDVAIATALSVEAALLHNFVWHTLWTWPGAAPNRRAILARLIRFHMGNGLISMCGNVILVWMLGRSLGWPYLPVHCIAIVLCSLVNFTISRRLIFATHAVDRFESRC